MAAATSTSTAPPEPQGAERRFLLRDVPWWTYVALRDALDDVAIRMTYCNGELELMSPSELHEESTKLLARLIEAWAEETDVDLRGFRSTTFRAETEKRGLEPDECYTLGPKGKDAPPHIAIEVIVGSPLLDKLAVYAGLNVPEVWRWRPSLGRVEVLRLTNGDYEPRERSELLPELDLLLLARFIRLGENQTHAVRAYRAALKGA
jgi:Uma2 family endonuclease